MEDARNAAEKAQAGGDRREAEAGPRLINAHGGNVAAAAAAARTQIADQYGPGAGLQAVDEIRRGVDVEDALAEALDTWSSRNSGCSRADVAMIEWSLGPRRRDMVEAVVRPKLMELVDGIEAMTGHERVALRRRISAIPQFWD